MSLKEHGWVWKTIAKIFGIGLVFSLIPVLVDKLGVAINLNVIDSQYVHFIGFGVAIVLFAVSTLYARFVRKITSSVIADPKMVSKVVVQIGGALKGETSMSLNELEKDALTYLSEKYTNVVDIVRDGEYAFKTKAGNDLDFLFEFLEVYDLSGKRVQTLTIKKGDVKQMEFAENVAKGVKLDWKVERINRV